MENDAHGVARLLHWRVRDRVGAEAVGPAYERLRGAGLPDRVSPAPVGDVGRLDGGGLAGTGQLTLAGMPAPTAPAPEPLDQVVPGAAVSEAGTVPEDQLALDLDGLPTPSAVVPGGYADRTPYQFVGPVGGYARALAEACDQRATELAETAGAEPPEWVGALGPVPADPIDREQWTRKTAAVAAYREHYGHALPPDQALGPCPPKGNVPARQAWHAAWDALGRPEQVRESATLTDAQLRARVTAWRREQVWAPDYVGAQLRRAEQAAAEYAARVEITRAELANGRATSTTDRDTLTSRLAGYEQLAAGLASRRDELAEIDHARAAWYTETTPVREHAEQAAAELRRRGIDPTQITARDDHDDRVQRARATQARAAEHQRRHDQTTREASDPQRQTEATTHRADDQREPVPAQREGQSTLDLPGATKPTGDLRPERRDDRTHATAQQTDQPTVEQQPDAQEPPAVDAPPRHRAQPQPERAEHRDEPAPVHVEGQIALDPPGITPERQDQRGQEQRARDKERQAERDRQARADRVEQLRQAARERRDQAEARRRRIADRLLARRATQETGRAGRDRSDLTDQVDRARRALAEVQRREAERQATQADHHRRDTARVVQHQRAAAERHRGPTLTR